MAILGSAIHNEKLNLYCNTKTKYTNTKKNALLAHQVFLVLTLRHSEKDT